MRTEIITLTRNDKYELLSSKSSGIKAIKIKSENGKFSEIEIKQRAMNIAEDFGYNFVKSNGVYFLELKDKFYIGKTNDFSYRLPQHTEVRNILSITFFMNNDVVNGWDESQILDIESVLIDYAIEFGFSLNGTLDNKKTEKRTKKKAIDRLESKEDAMDIWEKILFLNSNAIISTITKKQHATIGSEDLDSMIIDFKDSKVTLDSNVNIINQKDFILKQNKYNTFVDTTRVFTASNFEIFQYLEFKEITSKSYKGKSVGVLKKELAIKGLNKFLIDDITYKNVEKDLTNGESTDSWLMSSTLAFLRVSNQSKGKLKFVDNSSAKKMIKDLVDKVYSF